MTQSQRYSAQLRCNFIGLRLLFGICFVHLMFAVMLGHLSISVFNQRVNTKKMANEELRMVSFNANGVLNSVKQ